MSVGATTVWNPFGGGLALTTDVLLLGRFRRGGSAGGLRKTTVVSMGFSSAASAMPCVALTAARMSTACTTTDVIVCPSVFFLLACDSIRLSNTNPPPQRRM
jgi:hypothetical protein